MRFFFLIFALFYAMAAAAGCPVAEQTAREKGLTAALPVFVQCAIQQNDDDTQLYLARIYAKGLGDVAKSTSKALLFYHLSSENGNASAMVELSTLLTSLDEKAETRHEISDYLDKAQAILKNNTRNSFKGELLHPYALLMLASENPSEKWFYTTQMKSDSRAAQLLKNYQIDPDKKKQVIREASKWKQRKMRDIAFEVYSLAEFNEFYDTLYPKEGLPNSFARSQAVNKLKEKIESLQK
ncbi:MAG: sel1 repeat family protein [Alphaproteobacteria bacterium]|nr:sel1 repeat family protein [Alphaproteobacteria bacterium]